MLEGAAGRDLGDFSPLQDISAIPGISRDPGQEGQSQAWPSAAASCY